MRHPAKVLTSLLKVTFESIHKQILSKFTQFFKAFFTDVMRRDNNKFPNNSSLGMVSVFIGAALDLAVSNLTVTFPDLQKDRTYAQAPKPLLITSEKPCNSRQTGSSSLELSNLRSTLTFTSLSISLKFLSQAFLISSQKSSSQTNFNLCVSWKRIF